MNHLTEAMKAFAKAAKQNATRNTWSGRTGAKDLSVLLAHLTIVERTGKDTYHASVRDISQLSGVGRNAAHRSNVRLIKRGILHLRKKGTHLSEANLYTIEMKSPIFRQRDIHDEIIVCPTNGNFCGVFDSRPPGLGRTAWLIYEAIQQGECNSKEISERTGKCLSTVYDKLRKMTQLGIVRTTDSKYFGVVEQTNFAELSDRLGTAGIDEYRKQRHRAERENYEQSVLSGRFHNPLFGVFLKEHYPKIFRMIRVRLSSPELVFPVWAFSCLRTLSFSSLKSQLKSAHLP